MTTVADLIAGPNGSPAGAHYSVKFDNLWQQLGTSPYVANAASAASYWAVKFAGLWQQLGTGPYVATSISTTTGVPLDAWYNASLPAAYTVNRNGYITGVITTLSTPTPNVRVFLHNGVDLLLATAFSSSVGVYRFNGLVKSYTDYTVIALDPTNTYNLGRLDNLTPA